MCDPRTLKICAVGVTQSRQLTPNTLRQQLVSSVALDTWFCLADQAAERVLVLRFHIVANDTRAIPTIIRTTPKILKFGGAGIHGRIVKDSFGLTANISVSWSGVRRTVMDTATAPHKMISQPLIRVARQRICNRSRRSNRRAASMFGEFIYTQTSQIFRQC